MYQILFESSERYVQERTAHSRTVDKSREMASACWAYTTTEVAFAEAESQRSQKSSSHESPCVCVCVCEHRGTYESWRRDWRLYETRTEQKALSDVTFVPVSDGDSRDFQKLEVNSKWTECWRAERQGWHRFTVFVARNVDFSALTLCALTHSNTHFAISKVNRKMCL